MKNNLPMRNPARVSFWRDERFLRVLGQIIFLLLVFAFLAFLANNMAVNLRRQGLALSLNFLRFTSSFDIGETLIEYGRTDTFGRAFIVGLLNTLYVSSLGILFATLLGVFFGITRLSTNFLVRQIAKAYIEFLRNIPLLVLLIFLYIGFFIKLPRVQNAITLPGPTMLSNRGLVIPWGAPTETFNLYAIILGVGLLLAAVVWGVLGQYGRRTGRTPVLPLWSLLTLLLVALLGWFALPAAPLTYDTPSLQGLRMVGGMQFSPEFMALLTGLAIYTSAFIADVVRSGIQAVSGGQVEAARSLGLPGPLILRLIVFPQAMRVIIPPLTSQYLNLAKNSSLAVAIGYPELFHVSGTILNVSGRAVEVITIAMSIYLGISLATSAFMNWYNQRVRLVER
jgi:general L-amino acid transport system permease protein